VTGWDSRPLDSVVALSSGSTPSKADAANWGGSIPWVSAKDMKTFYVFDSEDHLTEKGGAAARIAPPHTVLLLVRGMTLHHDVPICLTKTAVAFNQDVKALRARDCLDSRFLAYWLLSQKATLLRSVDSASHGTGRLPTELLQRLEVPLPALDEQREIADALAVLDDKMAINQRMNRTLLEMGQSLFRACFIDFDPAIGAEFPPIDLYPGGFREEAGRRVPVGWEVQPIGEVVRIVGGATPSTRRPEFWNGVFHWATPKDLAPLEMPVLLSTERRITDVGVREVSSGLLPTGTVLLSSRAPIGYLAITEVPVAVNQGFIALRSDGELGKLYLLHWLATHMDLVLSRANGTTFLEVSKAAFRPLPVLVPPANVRGWFEDVAGQFHSQIVSNLRQNAALRIARDALIPQLMSGDLRVVDLHREVA